MLICRLAEAFRSRKIPFAVAGGYAVALHGAVRGTVDVDIILRIRKDDFIATEAALREMGLVSRLPVSAAEVFDFRDEYVKNRNMLAWSFWNPGNPAEIVDVMIAHDLSKMRTSTVVLGGHKVPLLALRDLIAMKKAAARPQDLEDVRALEALHR
jgi:hypothetical protein